MRPPHFQQTKNFGADKSPNIAMTCKKSFEKVTHIYIQGEKSSRAGRKNAHFKKSVG